MNLGKSIYNLLKRQAEVYVKDLGSFKRNHTSATYDEKRHVYLPPISYIDFDKVSSRGYDFIQYTQQLYDMDRKEAEQMVATAVASLKETIQDVGQAKLDDLGYLVSYGQGYVFKALDLSGFDYQTVEALPNKGVFIQGEQATAEPVEVTPELQGNEAVSVEAIEQGGEEEAVEVPIEVEENEEEVHKSSNTIWYVVMAVIALGVIAALYFSNRNGDKKPSTIAVTSDLKDTMQTPTQDSIGITDSLGTIRTDTAKLAVDDEGEVLVPANHHWQIVIGSHRTLAQAYEQAEAYHKAGFPKVKVIPSNLAKNRKKVIWDSYATKTEVDSALRYVQRHIVKDAWPDRIK